jgi:cellobiose phosphorylase
MRYYMHNNYCRVAHSPLDILHPLRFRQADSVAYSSLLITNKWRLKRNILYFKYLEITLKGYTTASTTKTIRLDLRLSAGLIQDLSMILTLCVEYEIL